MIVDAERLLSPGIVELDPEDGGEGGDAQRLPEAKLPLEQQLVVLGGHRIAHGQPRDEPQSRLLDMAMQSASLSHP